MRIISSTPTFLGAAAFALLAGCAGNSQVAPSTTSPDSHAVRTGAHAAFASRAQIAPGRYAHYPAVAQFAPRARTSYTFARPNKSCKKNCYSVVMASDNTYGNLDLFDEQGTFIGQIAGAAGWGAAAYGNNECAFGSSQNGITVCTLTATSSSYTVNTIATLTPSGLSAGYEAYGLAFDSKGDLYGNNWPGTCIDMWKASTIAGYSGTPLVPDATACTSFFSSVYYMGTLGSTLYVNGYDQGFNMALATVKISNGKTKVLQDPIVNAYAGFPGGIAITKAGEVYVNNQFGTIDGWPKGKGAAPDQTVNWGIDPNDYTAIALDYNQTTLWAANVADFGSGGPCGSGYLCSQVVANGVPLNPSQVGTIVGTSQTVNEEYLGVAVLSAQK